jgi:hypothetical protein
MLPPSTDKNPFYGSLPTCLKTTVYITDRDVMNCLASDFGWADCVSCRKKIIISSLFDWDTAVAFILELFCGLEFSIKKDKAFLV